MQFRRLATLSLIGIAAAVTLLLAVTFMVGGSSWLKSVVWSARNSLFPPRPPQSTAERIIEQYGFPNLEHRPPLLSDLGPGEQTTIEIDASGCFYRAHYTLEFRGPTPLQVRIRRQQDEEHPERVVERTLSDMDVMRLDGAIAFYRVLEEDPDFICTSSERINISWPQNSMIESFHDGTCSLEPDNPYALSPHNLAWMAIDKTEP